MKHFLVKLSVFLLPIGIVLFLMIASAFYIGEAVPIATMVDWQAQSDAWIVYQPWYQNGIFEYKYLTAQQRQPSLMILGSSRMTFFRSALATQDPNQFYNASMDGSILPMSIYLFDELVADGTIPDVIIIGFDMNNFRSDASTSLAGIRLSEQSIIDNARYSYSSVRRVSQTWVENPMRMMAYVQNQYQNDTVFMGLSPLESENGYMRDGSRYILGFPEQNSDLFARQVTLFEERREPFVAGTDINETSLTLVEQMLVTAQSYNITIIGIMPPFRQTFLDLMDDSGDFSYRPLVTTHLESLFSDYNFSFYDFTDPQVVGGDEDEMIDLWHFSDLLSLRIYHYLLERHPDTLGQYSDISTLSDLLETYDGRPLDTFMISLPETSP